MSVLREKVTPDYDVPVFNVGQPGVNVLLLRIRLRRGEDAIEVRGVSFVLPVVLERVDVDVDGLWWGRTRFQGR
jgi:hypothetical protein